MSGRDHSTPKHGTQDLCLASGDAMRIDQRSESNGCLSLHRFRISGRQNLEATMSKLETDVVVFGMACFFFGFAAGMALGMVIAWHH